MNGDDLEFYRLCWMNLREFLTEIVDEASDDYPEAIEYLTVMNLIQGRYFDLDE